MAKDIWLDIGEAIEASKAHAHGSLAVLTPLIRAVELLSEQQQQHETIMGQAFRDLYIAATSR